MKICFIAPADNYHTIKWCKWFNSRGHVIHVVSFVDSKIDGVTVHSLNANVNVQGSDFSKLRYLKYAKKIRNIVKWKNLFW